MKRQIQVLLLLLLINSISFGYLNIYPTFFDKRIDTNDGYVEYNIFNKTSEEILYRCYLENDGNKPSLVQWGEVYPKSIRLKPKESKKIKLNIIAPKNKESKEYFGVLIIKEILKNNVNSKINLMTELKLKIRGYIGELKPKLKVSEKESEFEIINLSKRRIRGEVFFKDKKNNELNFVRKIVLEDQEKINLNCEKGGKLQILIDGENMEF